MGVDSTYEVVLEDELMETYFTQHTRLFLTSAMERLRVELESKKLQPTRSGVLILFADQLLMTCVQWLNELLVLRQRKDFSITRATIYEYMAVMLYSQCSGFSFDKTLDLLTTQTGRKLNGPILKFINGNILAYSPVGRGKDSSLVWNAQRDQTVMLGQFERRAFDVSGKVFLVPDHTICSLDDDLMGTRASDNQHKTISNRKADREGHTVDVISDALFRVVLQIRFARRGEKRIQGVRKLLSSLLDSRGQQCLQGIVVALDRGYARQEVLMELSSHGLSSIAIMPERYPKCHPFVGKSFLKASRSDDFDEWEEDVNSDGECAQRNDSVEQIVYDRPRSFVINDGAEMGAIVLTATKKMGASEAPSKEFEAMAVREYENKKKCKTLRFMHSLPAPLKGGLRFWSAVPYERSFKAYLFHKRDDCGRVTKPSEEYTTMRERLEFHLLEKCIVLTTGQRCADWFVLRQFRVTATEAAKIYVSMNEVREL